LSYGDCANDWRGDEDLSDPVIAVSGTISPCAQKSVCDMLYSLLYMAKYAQQQLTWCNWYLF
jgi:hypothetical protein